jgi:serine/threonine protein kinase
MAEVCLAKSFGVEGFQKTVAIKTILPHISEDENFVIMFIDEAKIAARLQHANICQVFDFGKISDDFGEHLYQVMEYIPGFSLKHMARTFWDKKKQVPIGAALHVIARVCEGLDYAHALPDRDGRPLGIVHRDVTPANILVSVEGAVKLIDFGIAKAAQRETKTQAGIVKGKFGYMTPEQLQGKSLDGRSDIFSLGVGLWELLGGRVLFNEPNELDNLRKIINGDYPDIREVRPDLSDDIADVVMRALAHDRDQRYQTAEEFAQDINQAAFKTRNFWNTTSMEKFIREHFPGEVEAEAEKRSKYADIKKEDFLKYPSVTDVGKKRLEEAEELDAGDFEDVEELEEIEEEEEEEEAQDRTVVSRVPQKKPTARPASREVSGVTPPVKRADIPASSFSGSLDLDAPRNQGNRQQSGEYPTFTLEPKPRKSEPAARQPDPAPQAETFNPRSTGVPPGYGAQNSGYPGQNSGYPGQNSGYPGQTAGPTAGTATVEPQEYPAYMSPYGELSAQNNSFINEPSMPPDESFVDETSAYRPGSAPSVPAQGYYGEDGQWYPYTQSQQVQGYYGEDGQWYPYPQEPQAQGYYGEDGQWYPYTQEQQAQGYYGEDGRWYPYDQQQQQQQQPQGYYGEDGQWYSYDQQQQPQGYYGEDGQWYPYPQQQQAQGYYGDDGQWHPYPNPYYQSTHSYPDYSYPDHSRPDLPGMNPLEPPKKR